MHPTKTQPHGETLAELTTADRDAALAAFFGVINTSIAEQRAAAQVAWPALALLIEAMAQRTDQSHVIRAILYSLYNGHPACVLDLVTLDWPLRKALSAVLLAFGFEDRHDATLHFFYDAMKAAIVEAGQWDWFIAAEESEVAA